MSFYGTSRQVEGICDEKPEDGDVVRGGKGNEAEKGRTDNYLASRERSSNGRLVEDVELEKGSNPFAKRAKDNLDRSNRPRIIYYIRLRWYEQRSVACVSCVPF